MGGEIAGERSRLATIDRRGRTDLSATASGATGSDRLRGGAPAIVDGAILLTATLLPLILSRAGIPGAHAGALIAFGLLTFVLLRRTTGLLQLRPATEIATMPVVTAIAAATTLVLGRAPLVGIDTAFVDAIRPWLIVSGGLVVARVVLVAVFAARMASFTRALDCALKRIFDMTVAAFILVLTAPVTAVVALAIWLDDRGPIFYRCERFGANGRKLYVLKFRKMRQGAAGPRLTSTNDERFTDVGRFLARTKLDELPQLWNVLRGQMSLVGPRPEDPEFVEMYPDDFAEIAQVLPGVTGLCQLAFAKEAEIIDGDDRVRTYTERYLPAKLKIDRMYVEQRSFLFDLKIIVWTALVLLRKDVAVHRQTGDLSLRRRRPLADSPSRAA
jgi:lipopolysaccharide/colanic/teichoic acid biosynthesis glycosyltransferase